MSLDTQSKFIAMGRRLEFWVVRSFSQKLVSLRASQPPLRTGRKWLKVCAVGGPKYTDQMETLGILRNTRASSKKWLPAALSRNSGHESSADWPTATEQRVKKIAAACSCLFSLLLVLFFSASSLALAVLLVLLGPCSLVWLLFSYSPCCFSLHRSSPYSSSRRYCLHLRGLSSSPSSGAFVTSTSSPSCVVESAAAESSSSAPSSNLRVYSGSLSSGALHFFTNTCPSGFWSCPLWLL